MLQFKARNFSERCSSLWAQFRSNEVETLWPALHEVQTGWSDGLSDFKFYVFMLLEPRYLLHFLQSATPSQVYVSWSEYVAGWAAEQTNSSQWLIFLLLLWAHPLLWALALIQPDPELIRLTKPAGNYLVLIVFYSGCISPFIDSCGWIGSQRGQTSSGTGVGKSAGE